MTVDSTCRFRWAFLLALALACALCGPVAAQPAPGGEDLERRLDLGFERGAEGWFLREAEVDSGVAHGGTKSVRLAHSAETGFALISRSLPIAQAKGRRVRLAGWLKTRDVQGEYAGLWLRVDRGKQMLLLDNMRDRGLRGTNDWTAVEIVADVPEEATAVIIGALLPGRGTAWVDDLSVSTSAAVSAETATLFGRVVAPGGGGIAGATVAVVPRSGMVPAAVAASAADGGFAARVPSGSYAVTATHGDFAPAFVPEVRVQAGGNAEVQVPLAPVERGFRLSGEVRDTTGASVGGAQVHCYRESDVEGDVFVTSADDRGRFGILLLHAVHGCSAEKDGMRSSVEELADGTPRQDLEIWRPAPAPQAVVDWIREQAVPLLTPRAGHGFADMEALRPLIGDARVVALGEATHGSREFFQLKHRMLEYLVSELGFTVFAIEANWPESEAVNDYVTTGEGDPARALAGLYFWTWNTEEVLDLIRWMREWNAVSGHRQVKFYGFDMQTAEVAVRKLAAVLGKVEPALAAELEPLRGLVAAGPQAQPPSQEELAKLGAVLQRGGERLQRSEAGGLGERELLLARQYVHVALQFVDRQRDPEAQARFAVRDRAMADNLLWIANVAEPGTRIVLWAHNGHVGNAETFIPWMGRHLESALGADYLPIGFLFHHGAFQAMDRSGEKTALRELSLGQPPAGTLEDTFERAGWPVCALDLRRLPAGPVADWFGRSQRMRETGSVFSSEENMLVTRVLPGDFEAVIFVESTTRARPNPPLAER